jgi:hypothetical protein
MKYYLIATKGKRRGFPVPVNVDLFLIGTDRICQMQSPLPGVAVRHCALVTKDDKVFVRDLGSDEGTVLNGERMSPGEELPLHKGDVLTVGPLEFLVQYAERRFERKDTEEWALKCLDAKDRWREPNESLNLMDHKRAYVNAADAAQGILDRLNELRGVVQGRLRVSREEDVTVLRLLDTFLVDEAEIALLRREIFGLLPEVRQRVLLDFKTVRRLSAAAAAMFNDFSKQLRLRARTLAMCRLQPDLLAMLRAMPLLADIPLFDSKERALAEEW